jgi:hypothetical protein
MRLPLHILKLVPVLVLIALALPTSASAQATRTWVSGVGDDANPCSRTAPCKTFAGAISKTATNGEINCLDPGGFGGVTITKSLTIRCNYTEGGVLVSGTNAIVVNAPNTAKVTLRGLDINGIGTGLNAIRILQAKSVKIVDTEIYGFVRNAIDFEPANNTARLVVSNVDVHHNNGNGVFVHPQSIAGGAKATVSKSDFNENGCGLTTSSLGFDAGFNYAVNCGTAGPGAFNVGAQLTSYRNTITDSNGVGIFVRGSSALGRMSQTEVTGNQVGLQQLDSGVLKSWGDNKVDGNTTNATPGTPTGPNLTFTKPRS